jgi:hypothetical protein
MWSWSTVYSLLSPLYCRHRAAIVLGYKCPTSQGEYMGHFGTFGAFCIGILLNAAAELIVGNVAYINKMCS